MRERQLTKAMVSWWRKQAHHAFTIYAKLRCSFTSTKSDIEPHISLKHAYGLWRKNDKENAACGMAVPIERYVLMREARQKDTGREVLHWKEDPIPGGHHMTHNGPREGMKHNIHTKRHTASQPQTNQFGRMLTSEASCQMTTLRGPLQREVAYGLNTR